MKRSQLQQVLSSEPAATPRQPIRYTYAGLDDAPLIIDFRDQLAQQREVETMLRQIAAVIDFGLACLARGVEPRVKGRG